MKPTAYVLAAGGSTRMGHCKGLLSVPGAPPVIQAHIEALAQHCAQVVVVTGAHHAALSSVIGETAEVVFNTDWQCTTPIDSLRQALTTHPAQSAVVTPVDTPPVLPTDLLQLVAHPAPCALGYGGKPGHPIHLDSGSIRRICSGIPLPRGLQTLLEGFPPCEANTEEVLMSWNTPNAWQDWHKSAGPSWLWYASMGLGLERHV